MDDQYIKDITVFSNQVDVIIDSESKYFLTHNKECSGFRERMMKSADDFDRGYFFGTLCICEGNQDRILERMDIVIKRTYQKGEATVDTEQRGSIYAGEDLEENLQHLMTAIREGWMITGSFNKETATEVNMGYR